jgi:hypothetical protein
VRPGSDGKKRREWDRNAILALADAPGQVSRAFPEKAAPPANRGSRLQVAGLWHSLPDRGQAALQPRGSPFSGDAVGPTGPRWLSTVNRIQEEHVRDNLVDRYEVGLAADDGFSTKEGSFSLCSFWLVECLTRAGRFGEARFALEKLFSYANHLSLYAEDIGPSGEALGNFPQAFTLLSLISAALHLDRALA